MLMLTLMSDLRIKKKKARGAMKKVVRSNVTSKSLQLIVKIVGQKISL